ncbi:hypothetical protein ABIE71_003838 [Bradyrhizobium diazoefficiens]
MPTIPFFKHATLREIIITRLCCAADAVVILCCAILSRRMLPRGRIALAVADRGTPDRLFPR